MLAFGREGVEHGEELFAAVDAQLAVHMADVGFRGAVGYHQLTGHIACRSAVQQHLQYLRFALSQAVGRGDTA